MAGTLFVVATPIGNLGDLTFRALRTLREVDLIAAEDTRRTAKLLAHYEIRKALVSLREHNERRETPRFLTRLLGGQNIALVSDAGTPAIADPGACLVRAARAAGISVVPIPGPNAIAVALSAVGIPADQFVFLGYPPPTGARRHAWFEELSREHRTIVFFEAPHRIVKTVSQLRTYVKRPIYVLREMTKIHEEYVECTNDEHLDRIKDVGEFTIVISPDSGAKQTVHEPEFAAMAFDLFCRLTSNSPLDQQEATALVASHLSISIETARKIIKKASILVKQRIKTSS